MYPAISALRERTESFKVNTYVSVTLAQAYSNVPGVLRQTRTMGLLCTRVLRILSSGTYRRLHCCFPAGAEYDLDGQGLDLRLAGSWLVQMHKRRVVSWRCKTKPVWDGIS